APIHERDEDAADRAGGDEPAWWSMPRSRGRTGRAVSAVGIGLAAMERFAELALGEHRHRAFPEVDRQLVAALPERARELVGPEDEAALARAHVEEERLDDLRVRAQQQLLKPLVRLAAIEPSRDDAGDERRRRGAGEEDEHLAADEREQRRKRCLIVEQHGVRRLAAAGEPVHIRSASAARTSPEQTDAFKRLLSTFGRRGAGRKVRPTALKPGVAVEEER